MPRAHKPHSGSLQFWPRSRAKRIYPRVRSWAHETKPKLLGFTGYKVGMTHLIYNDTRTTSVTKGEKVTTAATLVECPPLKILAIRAYTSTAYGLEITFQLNASSLDKLLGRKISLPKQLKEGKEGKLDSVTEIRVVAYTQPSLTGFGKKKPEIFEIKIGGVVNEAYTYSKSLLGKEIGLSEVFEAGQFVDSHGISKGYGFEGPIKRFGISLKSHKSEKKRRSAGNLGAWTPSKTSHTVPQHGQRGFHQRTEYNKYIFMINKDPSLVMPKGDFPHYGKIRTEYLVLKGSLVGARKRMIYFTPSIRQKKSIKLEPVYISLESKQ